MKNEEIKNASFKIMVDDDETTIQKGKSINKFMKELYIALIKSKKEIAIKIYTDGNGLPTKNTNTTKRTNRK